MWSRQEAGRAALRQLSGHVEEPETVTLPPLQHAIPRANITSMLESTGSYFGGNALQITDSPSTSPSLAATQLPHFESLPRSIRRRPLDGSMSTPGTSDVPSLSLSNSSFSDAPLRSPFAEHAPSQLSVSSTRTVIPHSSYREEELNDDYRAREREIGESSLRRVAGNLKMSLEEVQRVTRCMSQDAGHELRDEAGLMEEMGREKVYRVMEAVRSEEDRITQLASFRNARMRTDLEYPYRRHRLSGGPPLPLPLRSTSQSSASFGPDQLDLFDRSGPVPSPRAALESLTIGSQISRSPHSPTSSFEPYSLRANPPRQPYWNTPSSPYYSQSRQLSSSSKPTTLPERSYRSMDDYTQHLPTASGSPISRGEYHGKARRSIYGITSSPISRRSDSRQASRSPLIESPKLLEDETMETEEKEYVSSPQMVAFDEHHLHPSSRQLNERRASAQDQDIQQGRRKASRRASAEVLGLATKRALSPRIAEEMMSGKSSLSTSTSHPISHEEVMARLQRKVKERLAAKSAAADYSSSNVLVAGHSVSSTKSTSSPVMSKHNSLPYGTQLASLGRSGRKRQDSLTGHQTTGSPNNRSTSRNDRKPRKTPSLRGITREMERRSIQGEVEDARMDEAGSVPPDPASASAGTGIEALLSAAAIADSPRVGYV